MSNETKNGSMTVAEATRALAAATAAEQSGREAWKAAQLAERAANEELGRLGRQKYAAEHALMVVRGRIWIAKHSAEDVAVVRAGVDMTRMTELKLGKRTRSSGWYRTTSFDYNQTGRDVRAALAAEKAEVQS